MYMITHLFCTVFGIVKINSDNYQFRSFPNAVNCYYCCAAITWRFRSLASSMYWRHFYCGSIFTGSNVSLRNVNSYLTSLRRVAVTHRYYAFGDSFVDVTLLYPRPRVPHLHVRSSQRGSRVVRLSNRSYLPLRCSG